MNEQPRRLAALIEAHRNSPEARIDRDRAELQKLDDRSPHEIEILRSRIAAAEAEVTAPGRVLTDAERTDLALKGDIFSGPQSTTEGQIPASDFARAVQDDIALGIPATLARAFYISTASSGLTDTRATPRCSACMPLGILS